MRHWLVPFALWLPMCILECGQASQSTSDAASKESCVRTSTENLSDSCPMVSGGLRGLPADHPWVRLGYNGVVLSTSPLVVQVKDFMSQAECEAVIAAINTRNLRNMIDAQGSYVHQCKGCGTWFVREADQKREPDAIFDMLEERIGNLTGVSDHDGEASIQVTAFTKHQKTVFNNPEDAYILHHDKVAHPRRIATVLVPLRNLEPHEGGHTIFPAAQLDAKGDAVRRAFANITPPLGKYFQINDRSHSGQDKVGLKSPEAAADPNVGAARAAAEAACRDAARGTPSAVAMPAQAGTAIVFYHELGRSRQIDPMAWHAGCFVRGAQTRWTLQKFKESPIGPESGALYLPKKVGNIQVLEQWGAGRFKVLSDRGIAFRSSKQIQDKHPTLGLDQNQIFSGIDEGDWVKIDRADAVEPPKAFYKAMKAHNAAAKSAGK